MDDPAFESYLRKYKTSADAIFNIRELEVWPVRCRPVELTYALVRRRLGPNAHKQYIVIELPCIIDCRKFANDLLDLARNPKNIDLYKIYPNRAREIYMRDLKFMAPTRPEYEKLSKGLDSEMAIRGHRDLDAVELSQSYRSALAMIDTNVDPTVELSEKWEESSSEDP